MQKTGNYEIGSGNSLEVALRSPRIKDVAEENLSQVLRYVMVKVGLRAANWPDEYEKKILISHIQKNFGGNRIDEIRLAFDMAIIGELNVDANCFENFSCLYFSNIMYAYRQWARKEFKESMMPVEIKPKPIEKFQIESEYCFCKLKAISKLPVNVVKENEAYNF